MYKKAAVIVLGLIVALGFVGKAQADWIIRAPDDLVMAPGEEFAFPIYVTTDEDWNAVQFMFDFCDDQGDIFIDSVTMSGYGSGIQTVFDTCPEFGFGQANVYIDNNGTDYTYAVQVAQLTLNGYIPVTNDAAAFVVWGHINSTVTAPDTIEIDMTELADCGMPLSLDAVFATYPASEQRDATLEDGKIDIPLYTMTISFTPPPPQSVNEGDHLTITVEGTSSDPADELVLNLISGQESWMTWTDGNPGYPVTGTLDLDPGYCDDGQYIVVFQLTSNVHGQSLPPIADTINVVNVNRAPSCVSVDPDDQTVSINSSIETINVLFDDPDFACQPPHTGDALTITYDISPAPATSPTLVDNGDGTATLDWTPTDADVGDYTVTFTATDMGGLTAQCTAYIHVTAGCAEIPWEENVDKFAFHLKKMCAYAGEIVNYPVYMSTAQVPYLYIHDDDTLVIDPEVGGYDVLIAYDPSCMTLMGVVEDTINGYTSEYFDYNIIPAGVVDVWPAVRVVAIRDKANNVYTPPIPRGCQFPIFHLVFNMNHDWDPNYACDLKFITKECGDNSISSANGLVLFTPFVSLQMRPDCSVDTNTTVADLCDENAGLAEKVVLADGFDWVEYNGQNYIYCIDTIDCPAGDISAWSLETMTGDVNLNDVPYEIADAAFFNQVLLGWYGLNNLPTGWDEQMWHEATQNSDVNHNTNAWEMGDLVLMTAVINGFIAPLSYSVPSEPVKLTVSGDNIYIDAPTELGGVYLVIKYEGEIGEPVLGEYASGMTLDWNDLGGEL
ncbi:MAG: hypothetical protein DRP45_11480, partial [Candidatus Zixiibacteriota bacterium]